jgi:signal transduction histidine kinase/CheY-like chemotaxis protein
MHERTISQYALTELAKSENISFAIADKDQKISWCSKGFKSNFTSKRIIGTTLVKLFDLTSPNDLSNNKKKSFNVNLPGKNKSATISCLISKNKTTGYFVEIEQIEKPKKNDGRESSRLNKDLQSPKELQQILTLLVKEKSLTNLTEEILKRSADISKSFFGLVVFLDENNKKFDFIFYDPNKELSNKKDLEEETRDNLPFINKWLDLNKRTLIVLNRQENIGYNLTQLFQCQSLAISPCFFDNSLLASIIVGKKNNFYDELEINYLEQFAALLSFAISSIRTRELNTALENRLLQAQKLETIGKLSSGMAHDFSNLLSSIFGSLNLLKKKIPEREDVYRLLDNIENCSIRAKDLTKGLLSFGKPTPKRKELIKPNILLSEISKVITQTFPTKISFKSKIGNKLYDMLGNATEIYQVLLNLCVNAKEALGEKGEITLNATNLTVDKTNQVNYPLLNTGNFIWFSVHDTGAGISEENITKIFDPYFSTKDKKTGSGSGLGLYVTYGIIKAHNGHIEVSSTLNEGTTFDVYIPAYEPNAVSKVSLTEKIILLADDEVMLRDLLAELLESYGYNIIKVSTGLEAVKILTEEIKVDLAIIDYIMPEMDGLECIEKIRNLKIKIPIILSSGSLSLGDKIDYKKMGINSVLSKPYEFETMLATIQKLI